MKYTSRDLKKMARANLNSHWNQAVPAAFIILLLSFVISMLATLFLDSMYKNMFMVIAAIIVVIILALLFTLFIAGLCLYFLKLGRGDDRKLSDIFHIFRDHPDRYLICSFILLLISIVYAAPYLILYFFTDRSSLLFLFGIIIWAILGSILYVLVLLSYSQFIFILLDQDDLGALEAMKKSALLMRGSKGRLFYLTLSFIGWSFLGILSGAVGLLWILPYYTETMSLFYRGLNGELSR